MQKATNATLPRGFSLGHVAWFRTKLKGIIKSMALLTSREIQDIEAKASDMLDNSFPSGSIAFPVDLGKVANSVRTAYFQRAI